jgi:3-oxoacyl-[acyl-carrier protein] reductase
MIGLARSLVREFGSRAITANVVAPGFVATDMTADLPASVQEWILAQTPLGRAASPAEVAGVVLAVAGPAFGYVTGAVIPVDGGAGMGH